MRTSRQASETQQTRAEQTGVISTHYAEVIRHVTSTLALIDELTTLTEDPHELQELRRAKVEALTALDILEATDVQQYT